MAKKISKEQLHVVDVNTTPNFSALEEKIADYWEQQHIFARSLAQTAGGQEFVFYDGPPFATGLPHYGHLVASTTKDVFPRFQTMRGKHVERVWGWDCHGLPIENIIEKELALKDKKALEEFGVSKFCEHCRSKVDLYADAWEKTIKRLGRFVDMEHAYRTMDSNFMDSEWRVFSQLWKKGLVYQDYKSMHICPRCATALSNFEVTLGYKEVTDWSVIARFKLAPQSLGIKDEVSALAWTTTPWTLPGNMLLAVNPQATYVLVDCQSETGREKVILAKQRLEVLAPFKYQIIKEVTGKDLLNISYQPLMPYFAHTPKAFRIVAGDFVTLSEGTGIVHVAPAYGEDDYQLGKQQGLEIIHHVDLTGKIIDQVVDFADMEVRDPADPSQIDVAIIKYLAKNQQLFAKAKIKHSYPHCWRCDHALLNYATSSFFIKVTAIKKELLKANKKINWLPAHFRDGRMGDWLANARDWAISRGRYWGTPIPLWQSDNGEFICVASQKQLEQLCGQKVPDLHKHLVDKIVIKKNGKTYRRISEVFDCWFESGSMPFFSQHFPADFISEGQDQTRGWFYTLLVLAVALKGESSYKNVLVNGVILAADGKKMSKKLQNYPDPEIMFQKYGADMLRLYLMTSPVMKAESLNFDEKDVERLRRQVLVTCWHVFAFAISNLPLPKSRELKAVNLARAHWLDRYLITEIEKLTTTVTADMENYRIINAGRSLIAFVDNLSNFYLRLSRQRLKTDTLGGEVLYFALYRLSLLFAPIMPFFSELLYQNLAGSKDSVHLEAWPTPVAGFVVDPLLAPQAELLKQVISTGQFERKKLGLKIRQPLASLTVSLPPKKLPLLQHGEIQTLIKQELNVKALKLQENPTELKLEFATQLTPALLAEGQARELMRQIAQERKKQGLSAKDTWEYPVTSIPQGWQEKIEAHTNTKLILPSK